MVAAALATKRRASHIRHADESEEERLLASFDSLLTRWACKTHVPRMTSADVLQVARLAALRAIRSHEPGRAPLRAYVIGVVSRALSDLQRDANRLMRDPTREVTLEDVPGSDPFAVVDDNDLLQRVWTAARPGDQKVLALLLEGRSLQEIARRLRISLSVAEQRQSRLRKILRQLLGEGERAM